MSNPFEDLIAQLNQLAENIGNPIGLLNLIIEADSFPEVIEANSALQQCLTMIPFPGGNPDFDAIAGALGEAGGKIDNINETHEAVREAARTATEALGVARDVVRSVIISLQQGHQ